MPGLPVRLIRGLPRARPPLAEPGPVLVAHGIVTGPEIPQPAPLVTVDVTPGLALVGDRIDVLVMAANEHHVPLRGLWLGLVLPAGTEVGEIVAPTGTAALVDEVADRLVLRCPLTDLAPRDCVGLDAEVIVAGVSGRLAVTAFVTVDLDAAITLTASRVLPVL